MRRFLAPLPLLLLAACAPRVEAIQTAIAETYAAYTNTPTPTSTPRPTPTPTATSTPTRTPTATTAPTPETYVLSEEDMHAMMLTIEDLPTGFASFLDGSGALTYQWIASRRGSTYANFIQESGQFKGYSAAFERSDAVTGGFIRSWVFEFLDSGAAAVFVDDYGDLSANTYSQPMSFDSFGEHSAAYLGHQGTPTRPSSDITEIIIRQNNIVVGLTFTMRPRGTVLDEVEEYAALIAERLDGVLATLN